MHFVLGTAPGASHTLAHVNLTPDEVSSTAHLCSTDEEPETQTGSGFVQSHIAGKW